jgi:hypothetical protein
MAAKEILSGLLTRQNQGSTGGTFKDIAADFFSGSSNDSKRRRNVLIGTALWNAKESSMQNNVLKNLQENETQRTFELAGLTQKWDAYNTLINDDRAFKKDKNHFFIKAEAEFNRLNPNYDTETKNSGEAAQETKLKEITELQKRYEEIHNNKMTTGNITGKNYMTKEAFFKPFEDYYSQQETQLSAPKNVSIIHNAWDRVTSNFKNKDDLESKSQQITLEQANRNTFGYLVEPDKIEGTAAIEIYRKNKKGFDTTAFEMDNDDAKLSILKLEGVTQEQKNYLIRNIGEGKYTSNALQAKIVVLSADFDPYINAREIAGNTFEKQYERSGKKIPEQKTPEYQDYILRKTNFIDIQTKQGNSELNQLRSDMFMLKDLQANPKKNAKAIKFLETKIKEQGLGKIQIMALNTAMSSVTDPNVVAALELTGKDSGKSSEELKSDHMASVYEGILDFSDAILKTEDKNSLTNNSVEF